jgi:hypothetical protein
MNGGAPGGHVEERFQSARRKSFPAVDLSYANVLIYIGFLRGGGKPESTLADTRKGRG